MINENMDIMMRFLSKTKSEIGGLHLSTNIYIHGFKTHGDAIDFLKQATGSAGRQYNSIEKSKLVWHQSSATNGDVRIEFTAFVGD